MAAGRIEHNRHTLSTGQIGPSDAGSTQNHDILCLLDLTAESLPAWLLKKVMDANNTSEVMDILRE